MLEKVFARKLKICIKIRNYKIRYCNIIMYDCLTQNNNMRPISHKTNPFLVINYKCEKEKETLQYLQI